MTAAEFLVWGIVMQGGVDRLVREIFTISQGDLGEGLVPYLIIEEVFWEVEGQSENRKQELPDPHCCVACRSRQNAVRRVERETGIQLTSILG